MFDIGFSELLLVFVIGLIVLGPQRLPVAVKTVVGWIRTLRSLATTVQNELAQEPAGVPGEPQEGGKGQPE